MHKFVCAQVPSKLNRNLKFYNIFFLIVLNAREKTLFFVLLLYSVSTIHRFGLVLMFRTHSRIQSQSHFSRCLKKYQRNCKNEAASKEHVYFSCCFGVSLLFCTENLGILLLHSFKESQKIQMNRSSLCSLSQLKLHGF